MKFYGIRCQETGDVIETGLIYEDAVKTLEKYERDDKAEGIYEEDFYEIFISEEKPVTVRQMVNMLNNIGTRKVFSDNKKMYVNNQDVWDVEVKNVTYHKGYGYAQVNAVLHI